MSFDDLELESEVAQLHEQDEFLPHNQLISTPEAIATALWKFEMLAL